MTKFFTALFLGACLNTSVATEAPVLVCDGIGRADLEKIEVFENENASRVIAYDADGVASELTIEPAIGSFFEATIALPAYQELERSLQWRHTGWVVNIYAQNDTDRIAVDCQE